MGMAASQARYLGLTARKTNVEYEGQQINQSRTALGNQSASLWNQMLSLTVPTVPSVTDYTTLQYSFDDGINIYTISDMQSVDKKDADGTEYNKLVTYYFFEDVYKGVETTNSNPQAQKLVDFTKVDVPNGLKITTTDAGGGAFTYTYQMDDGAGGYTDVTLTEVADTESDAYKNYLKANGIDALGAGEKLYQFGNEPNVQFIALTDAQYQPTTAGDSLMTSQTISSTGTYMLGNSKASVVDFSDKTSLVDQTAIEQIINDFGSAGGITREMVEAGQVYKYEKNGNTYYVTQAEMDDCIAKTKHTEEEYAISSGIDFQPSMTQYYATTMKEKVENTDYAIMDDASGSGRYANMKLKNMSTNFILNAEETTNEAAYNDAMNQYNYDLNQYEKQMADINAKTSLIQEQDRTLELRLKQLETEQKALTTEMEAVKGVLQKNVESTFGTFK